MFRPCLVVPVYRHAAGFAVFSKRLPRDIPVIVVDDGNTYEEIRLLESLGYTLVSLAHNQGKGRAMLAGFSKAIDDGYTHALQIDADGQHDPDDIRRFLQISEEKPEVLINSCPIYDECAPKSRIFGRKITNFWVWVETGNKNIKDAMCGFRVYPLVPLRPLLEKGLVFKGMGGDIEILVRASWHGIEIVSLDTKVVYPNGGISNFSMIKDNIKITAMHTLLTFTMLRKKLFGGLCRSARKL